MTNPFEKAFDLIAAMFRRVPWFSTWSAAFLLSAGWALVWMIVFFLSTWLFDLSTTSHDFVYLFWLSIAAEAIIRWAENTRLIARLAKPHEKDPRGDNADFNAVKAGFLFSLGCTAMFFIDAFFEKSGLKENPNFFVGQQGINDVQHRNEMIDTWLAVASHSDVATPLFVGIIFRAAIYKRTHRAENDSTKTP